MTFFQKRCIAVFSCEGHWRPSWPDRVPLVQVDLNDSKKQEDKMQKGRHMGTKRVSGCWFLGENVCKGTQGNFLCA